MKDTVMSVYLLICAGIGLCFGLITMYGKKRPLYFKLMIFPVACQFFTRAFYAITVLCYGSIPDTFNLGMFGFASFFLFLYLPNVGAIDSLTDEKRLKTAKYRLIPAIVPTAEAAFAAAALVFGKAALSVRISFAAVSLIAGFAGYFNVKHLIIPDIENGIIRTIRKFNLVCLLLEILTLAELGLCCFELQTPVIYVQAVLGIFCIAFLPLLNREVKQWTQ